jgi:hypothetical protein
MNWYLISTGAPYFRALCERWNSIHETPQFYAAYKVRLAFVTDGIKDVGTN